MIFLNPPSKEPHMESPGKTIPLKMVVLLVFVLIFLPLLPILMSGRWDW